MGGLSFGGELLYAGQKSQTTGDSKPYVVGTTDLTFRASSDHYYAMFYTARLRVSGSGTILDTLNIGVPTPDAYGMCLANLAALYAGKASGNYTVSVAITTPTGTVDSVQSNVFSLP